MGDQAKPVLSTDKIDALLQGDTEVEHGRYASIAPTRAQTQTIPQPEFTEVEAADHAWRQTNHIWSNDELDKVSIEKHEPVTVSGHVMKLIMNVLYHGFNFVTGYDPVDPSPRSVAWRLIILESFAGVPGFVAAGFRHFYSLRTLKRDHGAIYTFLEEAENERMHLLVCLNMFEASPITRALCVAAQFGMTPFLALTYAVHPGSMHRFVGSLRRQLSRPTRTWCRKRPLRAQNSTTSGKIYLRRASVLHTGSSTTTRSGSTASSTCWPTRVTTETSTTRSPRSRKAPRTPLSSNICRTST